MDQKSTEIRNGCDRSHHIYLILQHWVRLFYDCLVFYIRSRNRHTVQSLRRIQLFTTPWTAAHQASLSITYSWSLLKLMSIESVMPSNHLILCHPVLFPPSIFPSIRATISSNSTPGYISRENLNLKRHMHPNVHSSTICNSWDMEAT